jgi:hypothetical protein
MLQSIFKTAEKPAHPAGYIAIRRESVEIVHTFLEKILNRDPG